MSNEPLIFNYDPFIGWFIFLLGGYLLWKLILISEPDNILDTDYTVENTVTIPTDLFTLYVNNNKLASYSSKNKAIDRIRAEVGCFNAAQHKQCDNNGELYIYAKALTNTNDKYTVTTRKIILNGFVDHSVIVDKEEYIIVRKT